jgi:hypothetical protein
VLALVALAVVALAAPLAAPRLALVAGTALLFALPGLWPLAAALSAGEARAAVAGVSLADAGWLAGGLAPIALAPLAAARLEGRGRGAVWAAALGAAVLFVVRVHLWIAAGQLPPGDLAALRRAAQGPPLSAVCAPEAVRDWVPAIAGRPIGDPDPWIPIVYREEWAVRRRADCVPFGQ